MDDVNNNKGKEIIFITLLVSMLLTFGSFIYQTVTSLAEENIFEMPVEVITTAFIHLAIIVAIGVLIIFVEGHNKKKDKEVTENV